MATTTVGLRQFLKKPQNTRIIRENIIASISIFMILEILGPFGVDELGGNRFLYFAIIAFASFFIGCCSGIFTSYILKLPLDPSLPLNRIHRNTVVVYLIHIPANAAVTTLTFGIIYCDHPLDIWWYAEYPNWIPFLHFFYYSAILGFIFYFGTHLRNRNCHLSFLLERMTSNNAQQGQRQNTDISAGISAYSEKAKVSRAVTGPTEEQTIHIKGNTIQSVLEIMPSQLIYIEAKANYADFWYIENGLLTSRQLRITLEQVKDLMHAFPSFVQCHRSYIINLHYIKDIQRTSRGYHLQMCNMKRHIPISRTFLLEIKERISDTN